MGLEETTCGVGEGVETGGDHLRQDLGVAKEGGKRPSVGGLGSDHEETWRTLERDVDVSGRWCGGRHPTVC